LCAFQFAMLLAIEFPDATAMPPPASERWWCAWARRARRRFTNA